MLLPKYIDRVWLETLYKFQVKNFSFSHQRSNILLFGKTRLRLQREWIENRLYKPIKDTITILN